MERKRLKVATIVCLPLLVLLVVALPFMGACAKPAPADKFILKFAAHLPKEHYVFCGFARWEELAKEKSEGRIVFEWYAAGALGGLKEQTRLLKGGAADISYIMPSVHGIDTLPIMAALDLPFAYTTFEDFWDDSNELVKLETMWQTHNVHPLSATFSGCNHLFCKGKVQSLEDIKGMKIKGGGGFITKAIPYLGAAPVTVIAAETYLAVQRGIVDGGFISPFAFDAYKLGEVCKNYVFLGDLGIVPQSYILCVNLDTWNELPKDIQKILADTCKEAYQVHWPSVRDEGVAEKVSKMEGAGVEVYYMPHGEVGNWREATKPLYEEWVELVKGRTNGEQAIKMIMGG